MEFGFLWHVCHVNVLDPVKFDQDEFQFTWIISDTLRICYSVNGV